MKTLRLGILTGAGIVLLVCAGIYIIANPIIYPIEPSLISSQAQVPASIQSTQKLDCGSPKVVNGLPQLTPEQQQSAISLAVDSKIFRENTVGLNYTAVTVGPNYSFDPKTCSDFKINAVTVGFKLGNGSSLSIYEDGNITKTTGASIMHIIHGMFVPL